MSEQTGRPILGTAKGVRQLSQSRRTAQALRELSLQPMRGAQSFGAADWQVHRPQKTGGGCADAGADPEQRIRREPVASRVIEPLDGGDQAQ